MTPCPLLVARFGWALGLPWLLLGLALLSPRPVAAQPVITPDASVMNMDSIGVYLVGYAYRNQSEQYFPIGWSGFFEDKTGVACEPYGTQNGRDAFLLHCPWRNGTGISFQQFIFRVPTNASTVFLQGGTAMKSDIITNSDGVTFRVWVNGIKLMDNNQTNDIWRDFQFDLTAYRGSNVTIRFEVDPGTKNNSSFDYALWSNRQLVLNGYTPPVVTHPAPQPLNLANVISAQTGDLTPRNAYSGANSILLSNDVARFRYAGADGTMEYTWIRPTNANDGLFGTLTLSAQMTGDTAVTVPLANSAAITWTQTLTSASSSWQSNNNTIILVRTFTNNSSTATVRTIGRISGKALSLTTTSDVAKVQTFSGGVWGPVVRRQQLTTPFYSGSVYYFAQENLFASAYLDHTTSSASSQSGSQATYTSKTNGTRVLLQERMIFAAGWQFAEVLPNLPAPPSPWRDFLKDKVVFDIWGSSFSSIANTLTNLADYGLTNAVAIVHNWQRDGYDNGLPAHYPANASLGGSTGMSNLIATGTRLGVRIALHENYVDYYTNYEYFNTNDIALSSSGSLINAWFNEGTGMQSFAVKPNAILPLAATQSPVIHSNYNTTANYLDVHSAVAPWFHVDYRATETGAATFARVWDIHRQLWAYERTTHGGPVFGEGNRHWYWSGYLDGVEAQYGQGWSDNDGFTAPLNVDFDLLKIHPLQLNHGLGYYTRWWPTDYDTNFAGLAPMVVLDQYRMQEAVFGHAGFLDGSVYYSIPLTWLEHNLLSPVMARHVLADPVAIQYESGGSWLDTTAAVKPNSGATNNRVRIQYGNGLTITANSHSNALAYGNWVLPQFGWVAEGAGVSAGTVLRSNVVVDFADTGDSLFISARAAIDWNLAVFRRVRPSVTSFSQTGTRAFRTTYQWDNQDSFPKNYSCFVHFLTNSTIAFQQDHALATPTSLWQPGQVITDGSWNVTISSSMPDGDYNWTIGLFDSSTGSRLRLLGADGGSSRILLGVLHLQSNGTSVTFTAETNAPTFDPSALYSPHLNTSNTVVDFGDVRTDGSVRLTHEGNLWHMLVWPRTRSFTLEFATNRFPQPASVQAFGGSSNLVNTVTNGTRWRLPLNGAREYRWSDLGTRPVSLIATGAVWRFQDRTNDQGTAWRAMGFDDSTWKSGPSQLGYGNNGEATLVTSNGQWATYFRRAFYVPDVSLMGPLTARLLRDDGAVIYLNGTEVWRNNMPAGTVSYNTAATTNVTGAGENAWYTQAITNATLQNGWNVVAAEVHQNTFNSSDLSFDFELTSSGLIMAQPEMRIRSGSTILSWPAGTDAGFDLYTATNLSTPVLWMRATNTPVLSNNEWNVSLTSGTNQARFYKLGTK